MEYINAEEFLKQSIETQQVLVDWWKKNECETDLVYLFLHHGNETRLNSAKIQKCILNPISEIIPLLTEGQLRKFIEHKTDSKVETTYLDVGYSIRLSRNNPEIANKIYSKHFLGKDLLRAYWKVALEIAKEKVKA